MDFELTVEGVVGTDTTFFFFFVGDVRTAALGRTVAGDFGTAAAFAVPGSFCLLFYSRRALLLRLRCYLSCRLHGTGERRLLA